MRTAPCGNKQLVAARPGTGRFFQSRGWALTLALGLGGLFRNGRCRLPPLTHPLAIPATLAATALAAAFRLPPGLARHAKHATALPLADTPDCNTAPADSGAQRTARIPSAGSDAASAPDKSLAPDEIVDHAQEDPRERQLPKVKSRGGASLLSETPYIRSLIPRPPSLPG